MSDGQTYDLSQARRFLRMLDPSEVEFCFQFFRKTSEGKDGDRPPMFGTLDAIESAMVLAQQRGYNITAIISETTAAQKKLDDIRRVRAAFIDFDAKLVGQPVKYGDVEKIPEPLDLERLKNGRFPPRMIIQTRPGNYHAYWPLQSNEIDDVEIARESFSALQSNLAQYYGSDPSVTGLNWCMAMPGFWRFKEDENKEPSFVEIIWESDSEVRYQPSAMLDALKKGNSAPAKKKKKKDDTDEDEDDEPPPEMEGNEFGSDEGRMVADTWLRKACKELSIMFEGGRDTFLNTVCWTAGGYIAGGNLDEEYAKREIEDAAVACGLERNRIKDKLSRVIDQGKNKPIVIDGTVISFNKLKDLREKYLKANFRWLYKGDEWITLIHWNGYFWAYYNGSYRKIEPDTVMAWTASWLNKCKYAVKAGKKWIHKPFQAASKHWEELLKQVKAATLHPSAFEPNGLRPNTWMAGAKDQIDARYCVPMLDGIYNAQTERLHDPNPGYFATSSVQIAFNDMYVEDEPVTWKYFLESVFVKDDETFDQESVDLLQEWFGYCLTSDVSRHKFMTVVGPPRSGKGTIIHLLTHILGENAVGSFDFSLLTESFGIEDLIHKTLAVSPDVRDMTSEINRVLDVFLRMTSGDIMNVQRKNKSKLDVKFPAKIMLMTNEVPEFKDTSGAIMSRLLLIQLHQSFVGREDLNLLEKLKAESPAIVRWSLMGLKRLLENGAFTLPESAIETRNEIIASSTPLVSFAQDRLEFDMGFSCNKDWLYAEYYAWALDNGFKSPMHKLRFYRQLKGTYGDKYRTQQSSPDADVRIAYIKGIGIKNDPNRAVYTSVNPPSENKGRPVGNGARADYDERNPPPHHDIPF